ncbi:acyltransferase PapA [Mycobacterium tuberculosis variant bovis BCG]|nr:acyltransferase PapA [Mycobacterium tuberculosis variant bovis BCG]
MTYVINAHLRRHDTYRSWFELRDTDHIVRHSIADPADIEFVPTTHGEMTSADLRQHIVATPDSLHWDCFSFGVIQRADSFTFYASIDHLHADGQFVGVGLMEFQSMYTALIMGEPPIGLSEAGSYVDFCVRQHEYTSALTVDSRRCARGSTSPKSITELSRNFRCPSEIRLYAAAATCSA